MPLVDGLRTWLRSRQGWIRFRELQREGFVRAANRSRIERKILSTPPVDTPATGPVEVRMLTWRRDCLSAIWALKTFFRTSGKTFPLFIHDGGLAPGQPELLQRHFPKARLISRSEADALVVPELKSRGFERCASYRDRNGTVRKLFDFFLLSSAQAIISIDSDIVFFRKPSELIEDASTNLFNRDVGFFYSMSPDELEESFGIRPPPLLNSGLSRVRVAAIKLDRIDQWLAHPKLFDDVWVTEQTLAALCATVDGFEFLPPTYEIAGGSPIQPQTICRHYAGRFRPFLYTEGMPEAERRGIARSNVADQERRRASL